jgi:hypothetical protein
MSSTSPTGPTEHTRGQTELFATLVAVLTVCIAVSVYAGFLSDVVPKLGADRSLEEATADSVWDALNDGGYYNSSGTVEESVELDSLPQGHSVAINVTYVGDDGYLESVGAETFGPQGEPTDITPPPSADRHERPVPIKLRSADIRPGVLTVVVWS